MVLHLFNFRKHPSSSLRNLERNLLLLSASLRPARFHSTIMPSMIISRNSRSGNDTIDGNTMKVFTGQVWIDPVLIGEGMSVNNVTFTPCARTNWHTHGGGQLLRVLAGSGWVCDKGAEPQRINVGDVVWCPPGTTHWHGADDGSYMLHQAVSHGSVEWLEPVSEEEYGKKKN